MATLSTRAQTAAAELAAHSLIYRPEDVVDRLQSGLMQLRDLLADRLHIDVERNFGVDSMVAPISLKHELSQLRSAEEATAAFAAVLVADESAARGFVDRADEWMIDWVLQLQFGDAGAALRRDQADPYRPLTETARRMRFVSVLQRAVPESLRTPPVIFLLFPLAVRIVAAMAFGDEPRANALRAEQANLLAVIRDCHECRGRVLANEERCRCCGNPLWTFAWLRES
jgi:hypothetical protein